MLGSAPLRWGRRGFFGREGTVFKCACRVFAVGFTCRLLKFLELLVKVLVELDALDDCSVGLLELLAVEADEDGLDVVDELVDPRQVEEGAVDGLGRVV